MSTSEVAFKAGTAVHQAIEQKQNALGRLRTLLNPGDTIYTNTIHTSRSGLSHVINAYLIRNNEPQWLSGYIARAGLFTFDAKRGALRISGCGVDMGFHLVYELSRLLWPDGFGCIGEGSATVLLGGDFQPTHRALHPRCPSNDHSNGDRDYTPHNHNDIESRLHTHWHRDGGYALRQRWLS